jgi:hypothetical protein
LANTSFSHKYLSLPLIPVEQYLELFPEHADQDEHELMISRINHEHAEREKLEQARQELLKRKQALIAENKKRKDDLANLDQDLERFVDVCFFSLSSKTRKKMLIFSYRLQNLFKRFLKKSTKLVHFAITSNYSGLNIHRRRLIFRYPRKIILLAFTGV